jgi:hypothetical protein
MNARGFLALALLLLFAAPALAGSMTRDMPASAPGNSVVQVTLNVSDVSRDTHVVIGDSVPAGSALREWSISGAQEEKENITFIQDGKSLIWEFTANRPDPVITYSLLLPSSGKTGTFEAVYAFSPDTVGKIGGSIRLLPSIAGPKQLESSVTRAFTAPFTFVVDQTFIAAIVAVVLMTVIIVALLRITVPKAMSHSPQGRVVLSRVLRRVKKILFLPPIKSVKEYAASFSFSAVEPPPIKPLHGPLSKEYMLETAARRATGKWYNPLFRLDEDLHIRLELLKHELFSPSQTEKKYR